MSFSLLLSINGVCNRLLLKMLSPDADRIHLDVSAYAPGIYVYEYNGVSNKFIVE